MPRKQVFKFTPLDAVCKISKESTTKPNPSVVHANPINSDGSSAEEMNGLLKQLETRMKNKQSSLRKELEAAYEDKLQQQAKVYNEKISQLESIHKKELEGLKKDFRFRLEELSKSLDGIKHEFECLGQKVSDGFDRMGNVDEILSQVLEKIELTTHCDLEEYKQLISELENQSNSLFSTEDEKVLQDFRLDFVSI